MFGVFVVTGIVLFFSFRLGIYDWAHPLRPWLIGAFILSGAVLLTYLGSAVQPWIASYAHDTRVISLGRKHLHKLNPAEKEHCKYFTDHGGRALTHNMANGAIQSLLLKGILIAPVQQWPNGNCDFNIQPWALEYLRKHPDLLN
jgi:hypothetical protein